MNTREGVPMIGSRNKQLPRKRIPIATDEMNCGTCPYSVGGTADDGAFTGQCLQRPSQVNVQTQYDNREPVSVLQAWEFPPVTDAIVCGQHPLFRAMVRHMEDAEYYKIAREQAQIEDKQNVLNGMKED